MIRNIKTLANKIPKDTKKLPQVPVGIPLTKTGVFHGG